MKMNYPVLVGLNHDDLQDTYGPMLGLPTSIMISRDAKVCSKHMGLDSKNKFEDEIKSLLSGSEDLYAWRGTEDLGLAPAGVV